MQRCFFVHHPRGDVRECAVRLADDQYVGTALPVPPGDRHRLAVARMEPIEDPAFAVLIPGSMSLLRPEPARAISPLPSPEPVSGVAPVAASTMSSISSTGLRPNPAPAVRATS